MSLSTDGLKWILLGALGAPTLACGGSVRSDTGERGGGGNENPPGGVGGRSEQEELRACSNPKELGGGFVRCEEGEVHRASVGQCPTSAPRSERIVAAPEECEWCCEYDSDCPGEKHYCVVATGDFPFNGVNSHCLSGCLTDSDCESGQICECGAIMGACVQAECATDGDCPGEMRCTAWLQDQGCGVRTTYSCQTPADQCASAQDCSATQECRPENGVRKCLEREHMCAIGRPFLVEGAVRTAGLCERRDWSTELQIGAEELDEETRELLAAHWERAAQMEHASIAAFARFSLQLLSIGAPAELIEATTQALADETRHARSCFGVASAYRGYAVGPLPLSIEGALSGADLPSIVRTTIEEGCVGETVAALEAARSAEGAEEEKVASLLRTIAEEETRHAELAYRFVAWVLDRHPELSSLVRDEFERALSSPVSSGQPGVSERDLSRYGVLTERSRHELRQDALRAVVRPCWEQLSSPMMRRDAVERGARLVAAS